LTDDLAGLVLASPSNPTGTMLTDDELEAISERCSALGIRLISDEIYHGITYDRPAQTALAHSSSAVVVQSFSKYFSMTGWRLGWLVLPSNLVGPVERLAQNLMISPPTLSQHAGIAAFDSYDETEANVRHYATNRQILLEGLPAAGLDRLAPADGAFYVYAAVDHLTDDSQLLCAQWLDQIGVAATPGVDFDPTDGHKYVRFSYSESSQDMAEAVARLKDWSQR
jgi:aspartate/methionine/tyrosine aminotransferase